MKKKHHSAREIATKLAKATELAKQGKFQREIARSLGVTVMTLHRWRKTAANGTHAVRARIRSSQQPSFDFKRKGVAELELENAQLLRRVLSLMLEELETENESRKPRSYRGRRRA